MLEDSTAQWAGLVHGIPVRQPLYANDFLLGILLLCTLILAAILSDRKGFLGQLTSNFFRPRNNDTDNVRTTGVLYRRTGMLFVTFASLGLLLSVYAIEKSQSTMGYASSWGMVVVASILFFLAKHLIFIAVDHIFFDSSMASSWEHSYRNWLVIAGIPMYLLGAITILGDLSPRVALPLLLACTILLEFCLIYKALFIFLQKKYGILQLFVYLCTLELMPLLIAGKALVSFV